MSCPVLFVLNLDLEAHYSIFTRINATRRQFSCRAVVWRTA